MEILYAADGATVTQVMRELPNAPTDNAVRRLLQILEDKGYVQRSKVGREHVEFWCLIFRTRRQVTVDRRRTLFGHEFNSPTLGDQLANVAVWIRQICVQGGPTDAIESAI